jgi:hypothetical protein
MENYELTPIKHLVVTKSNALIEANYKLTITEQKIVLFLVSKIRKDDDDFKTYILPIKEFYELLGYRGSPKYSEMRKITKDLMGKVLEIKEDKKLKQISWLSYVEYNQQEGNVSLSFDPRLKPYLLQLKREFTSYKLKNVMELKSNYAIRMYEILKKWQTVKEIVIPLTDLRQMLGTGDKHPEYHNFKKRVLNTAKQEVKEKTDIFFDYEELKKGRKVTALRFTILPTMTELPKDLPISEDGLEDLFNQLQPLFEAKEYVLNEKIVKRWIELANAIWEVDPHQEIIRIVQQSFKAPSIRNHLALVTYILNEKKACIDMGKDHFQITIEAASRKVIREEHLPDWFRQLNNDSNSSKEDVDRQFEQEKAELEAVLEKRKKDLLF